MPFTEEQYENALIELFTEELGYNYNHGAEIERDYSDVVLKDILYDRLMMINKGVASGALEEAVRIILTLSTGNVLKDNMAFHRLLTEGVSVNYYDDGNQSEHIQLIDVDHPFNNDFLIVNQFTIHDVANKRPDLIVFVNGLPLVVMELKSCSRENTDVSEGFSQIRNYLKAIPSLFTYNSFVVISDMINTKSGTITASEDRYMAWKSVTGDEEVNAVSFNTHFKGMFDKERLIDLIHHFVLFMGNDEDKPIKILAAYHQYYAVNKAVASTQKAVESDGKAGVFWHTQGSGKSLSMVFYTRKLLMPLKNPTIVVITDRNDLDNQLFGTFTKAKQHLRQTPLQAESRANLKDLLNHRQAGGIIFTTIQKFEEAIDQLSDRRNIIVMADEAHRSQYGLEAKVDRETGKLSYGMAKYVRDALPNATFIGFTGTPIDSKDRSTREIFGDYIDIYDMTKAVEDGATKPIYYEPRVVKLKLQKDILEKIDREYDLIAEEAEVYQVEKSKKELGTMEAILGADETIDTLCRDLLSHYEERKHILAGKAMIVAYSRKIAMKIYRKILDIAPSYQNKLAIIMTSSNQDPEEWFELIGDKKRKKELEIQFKDPKSELKIVIVVDMWLTGFDVPCLNTMYLYKPMKGHTLMQAITRVNRVYGEKEGGLIVGYVGIAADLKQAMKDFTPRDKSNFSNNDISKTAYPKFLEKLSILKDLFHGFDYTPFFENSDSKRANVIVGGINFILRDDELKELYLKEASLLRQAETLCRSLLDERTKLETAFFDAVRSGITKINGRGKLSLKEINERISHLLKASIQTTGVVKIFDENATMSIFDDDYLQSLKKMEQKNLALALLKRLLKDEIKAYKRTNLVKSELFSERMAKLMLQYQNAQITNAEVIAQLMQIVEDMKQANTAGANMGLTAEELAFYDALSTPEGVKEAFSNEKFIKMTHELADMIRKSKTIDWQLKESARARMRSMIKRLLKKFKYPPEGREKAIEMVIKQAEHMADMM